MRIRVTAEHIRGSMERDSNRCMIADALRDAIPNAQYILVDTQAIRYSDPVAQKRYKFFTPPAAQRNLLRFDHGVPVKPFSFALDSPQVRDMGWTGQRSASATRRGRTYRKTGRKRSIVTYKERVFGLRKVVFRP